jgi:hypothetical protein
MKKNMIGEMFFRHKKYVPQFRRKQGEMDTALKSSEVQGTAEGRKMDPIERLPEVFDILDAFRKHHLRLEADRNARIQHLETDNGEKSALILELEARSMHLETCVEEEKARVHHLETENGETKSLILELEARSMHLETCVEEEKTRVHHLETENGEAKSLILELEARSMHLETCVEEQKARARHLETENGKKSALILELEARLILLEKSIQHLETDVGEKRARILECETEFEKEINKVDEFLTKRTKNNSTDAVVLTTSVFPSVDEETVRTFAEFIVQGISSTAVPTVSDEEDSGDEEVIETSEDSVDCIDTTPRVVIVNDKDGYDFFGDDFLSFGLDVVDEINTCDDEPNFTTRNSKNFATPSPHGGGDAKKKTIEKIDPLTGNVLDRYRTQSEAAKAIGVSDSHFSKSLSQGKGKALGFVWKIANTLSPKVSSQKKNRK